MANFFNKILSLFCCSSFKSSCCENKIDVEGENQTQHKEFMNIEYTNKPMSYYFELGNSKICFLKCSKVSNPS